MLRLMYGFALIRPQGSTRAGKTEMTETKVGSDLNIIVAAVEKIDEMRQFFLSMRPNEENIDESHPYQGLINRNIH